MHASHRPRQLVRPQAGYVRRGRCDSRLALGRAVGVVAALLVLALTPAQTVAAVQSCAGRAGAGRGADQPARGAGGGADGHDYEPAGALLPARGVDGQPDAIDWLADGGRAGGAGRRHRHDDHDHDDGHALTASMAEQREAAPGAEPGDDEVSKATRFETLMHRVRAKSARERRLRAQRRADRARADERGKGPSSA